MWLTLSVVSAVIFGSAGWFMKVSQMKSGTVSRLLLWLYIIGTLGFGLHMIIEKSYVDLIDPQLWTAGLIIGVGSALGNYVFMKALSLGPASLTSPMSNANIVLVVLFGTFFYNEVLGIMQFISIALLLLATILIAQRNETLSISSPLWYSYIMIAIIMFALRNGGLKVTAELDLHAAPVLFIAYGLSILFFIPPIFKNKSFDKLGIKMGTIYGIISGVCSYGGMQLYAMALERGPANLVAPIFATNGLLVSLLSIILYKEKLSFIQWLAFICLILGLICIRITL